MTLKFGLSQSLGQNLVMTQQLRQAIEMLQLGRLEFQDAIEKEVLENPILEEIKEDDYGKKEESSLSHDKFENNKAKKDDHADWETYIDHFSDYQGSAAPKGLYDREDLPSLESYLTKQKTLTDHLFEQLRLQEFNKYDEKIALYIIGNLNKDGYLCVTNEEIITACGCTDDDIERILEIVRSFDPLGVGSRNLQECLLIQLEHMGQSDSLAAKIITNHLDKIEKRRYEVIAKSEKTTLQEIYKALEIIKHLEPKPGRPFFDDDTRYVVPDVYVYKINNEYIISLNEDGIPKLRISPYYLRILKKDEGAINNENPEKQYLSEKLKSASWLIRSIAQRQQTIYKVAESIVKFQKDFLDHGLDKLRPLTLKQVAEDVEMHESTISRVTTNKYIHTAQGVFELKYFFTSGLKTGDGDISSCTIKNRIKMIIEAESANSPINDQEIAEILNKEDIKIARRTVAKYRETLGIEPSSRRRRLLS